MPDFQRVAEKPDFRGRIPSSGGGKNEHLQKQGHRLSARTGDPGRVKMRSGILWIATGFGLEDELFRLLGEGLDDIGKKPVVIWILLEHEKLVATLEIGGNEKGVFAFWLDIAPRSKVVRLVDLVKTRPADPDHFLEIFITRLFPDTVEGDEVDHDSLETG